MYVCISLNIICISTVSFLPMQMLLCVGTFFVTGDDCKMAWQKLLNGELKGIYFHMYTQNSN